MLQALDDDEIAGGVALTTDYLLLGYGSCGKMSLWKWNGKTYDYVSKRSFMPSKKTMSVHNIKKNPFL